jgi:hypothetical protein
MIWALRIFVEEDVVGVKLGVRLEDVVERE